MLSQLQPKQSALAWPKSAFYWKSPRFGRIMSAVTFIDKVIPGIASRLSHWMRSKNYFPRVPVEMQLIAFGSATAVFKLDWESGVKVLRVYRKSLGKSTPGLLESAKYYENNYKMLLHWYGGPLDLVLPMEFLVLQGLPLMGPVVASLQPYVQVEKKDVFQDFPDTNFVQLMKANSFMRNQFLFFAEQTLCQWHEHKVCYDFVGRQNVVLFKQGRHFQLKIVDVGFFKFHLPEHNHPEKVAQIGEHIQRLTHLYQLAKRSD